jgi:hypothetical protein
MFSVLVTNTSESFVAFDRLRLFSGPSGKKSDTTSHTRPENFSHFSFFLMEEKYFSVEGEREKFNFIFTAQQA